jgi:4-alpha-glucanotransferase
MFYKNEKTRVYEYLLFYTLKQNKKRQWSMWVYNVLDPDATVITAAAKRLVEDFKKEN